MGFISKIFGAVPVEERKGIHLDFCTPQWKISEAKDIPSFLRALADLVPPDSILYLEGGTPPTELLSFLRKNSVSEQSHVAMGTIWPKPKVFHIPATREILFGLADLAEHCASPEVAIHLHIYRQGRVLLQWHDALSDPFYISKEIPEERVQRFCADLGVKYKTEEEGEQAHGTRH